MPRPANRSSILPTATTGTSAATSRSRTVSRRGRHRKITAVGRSRECARTADERPGDDSAKTVTLNGELERDCVDSILLVDGNHILVSGNLKHAVRGCVDDGLSRADVLGAELVDNRRPRRCVIAERAASDSRFERVDERLWKAIGKHGNGRSSTMPIISQCPVTESFPGDISAIRPTAARGASRPASPPIAGDMGKTERAEGRDAQRDGARDVSERVAAFIAVHRRVGQRAGANAVEHEDDDSGELGGHGWVTRAALRLPSGIPHSPPTSEATLG